MRREPERTVTIRQVALRAGVGVGTVSRVLNGSPLVSAETRQRVQRAIDELNFVPNQTARRLSTGKAHTISVIVPFFTRPAMTERLRGIQDGLLDSPYDLNVYNVETVERLDRCLQVALHRQRSDGVILVSLPPRDGDISLLACAEAPVVLVDANHPALGALNRVVVDDVAGGCAAVRHLIDLGHRRIGYICDWLDSPFNFTSSRDRFIGYRQALEHAGLAYTPEFFGQGEHSRPEARRLAVEMLRQEPRPSAIFAASDTQATGVLEAARELGLRVPADLSVIGYDDIEIAAYIGLTTIRQSLFASGRKGVELLLGSLQGRASTPACIVMPTELIRRDTTAPLTI